MYNLNFKYICNFFTIFLFQLIFIKIKSNNDKFKLIDESGAEQGQETLAMCYYLGYKYYDGNIKKCFKNCDNKFVLENSETDIEGNCFDNYCPDNYPYKYDISSEKKCLKICPDFYKKLPGSNKKFECLEACLGEDYHFRDEKECIDRDTCGTRSTDMKIYFDPSVKICDFSCDGFINKYIDPSKGTLIECKSGCDADQFYNKGEYICLSSCDYFYQKNSQECLNECIPENNFVEDGNICVNECNSKLYTRRIITINSKNFTVDKCILERDCKFRDFEDHNRCYSECPEEKRYTYHHTYLVFCYNKCPDNTFIDNQNKNCSDEKEGCPDDFPYYEKIEKNYICQKNCSSNLLIKSLEDKECVTKCSDVEYKYIGSNNKCLTSCSNDPIRKYTDFYEENGETIYKCALNCGEKYTVNDTKFCVNQCDNTNGNYYLSENDKTCYLGGCELDKENPISIEFKNNTKICSKRCYEEKPYFQYPNKCTDTCPNITDYIHNVCLDSCDTNSLYKFYYKNETVKTCLERCPNNTKYLYESYTCVETCPYPNNVLKGRECKKSCEPDERPINISTGEIICLKGCEPNEFYYEDTPKICLNSCEEDDFQINGTQICVKECPLSYFMYYEDKDPNEINKKKCVLKCPEKKPYYENRRCEANCSSSNKYLIEGDVFCRAECPANTVIDGRICRSVCPKGKFLDFHGINCIDECPSEYPHYVEGVYQCIKDCPNDIKLKEDNKCVSFCSDNYPYLNGLICQKDCSGFVNEFENNICVDECPNKYKFYKIKEGIKFCSKECDFALPDGQCVSKCEKVTYYPNRTCLENCPSSSYFVNDNDKILCYEKECPNDYPYHDPNGNNCSNICNDYINITTNECGDCPQNFKIFEDNGKKYCVNDCESLGLFKSERNCFKYCSKEGGEIKMVENIIEKTCECIGLFYIDLDNENKSTCLEINKVECDNEIYKLRLYGTKECLKDCKGKIYSLGKKFCYIDETYCPENTIKTPINKNNEYECFCAFNYYIENGNIICLRQGEECPSTFPYLKPNSKECTDKCSPPYKIVGKSCLGDDCIGNYFYMDENNKYKCNSSCPEEYPKLIEDLKQCVKKCIDTDYYITFGDKCISTCSNFNNSIVKRNTLSSGESFYECACTTDLWYWLDGKIICDNVNKNCKDIPGNNNLLYLIKDTRECVETCPENYHYSFNYECFTNCTDSKNYYYDLNIIPKSETECKCANLWKNNGGKINCLNSDVCFSEEEDNKIYLNTETLECLVECPTNYKIFNYKCYEQNCPELTEIEDANNKECKCIYKWYKYNDTIFNLTDLVKCLKENEECKDYNFPYYNDITRECLKDLSECPSTTKKFNNVCYKECPTNTKEINSICVCDISKGKWHQYTKDLQIFLECGLEQCPKNKIKLDNDTLECKFSCDNKYHYQDICYTSCPNDTVAYDEITKNCIEYLTFDNPENIEALDNKTLEEILRVYNKTSPLGLVYNIDNSTMQIYTVNKKEPPKKDDILRFNLSYIDLSECINQLYTFNDLSDDTDIIIMKYDIGYITNSTTINPVEYRLINSKTGETLSLKPCENHSIIIYYPINIILNNYLIEPYYIRKLDKDNLNLNLREKFYLGKELFLENPDINTFNFENKIYGDMCFPIILNGKDVILEDRVNYLYPFFVFCEDNCIYNETDFINERIVCYCSPKYEVNFHREFVYQITEPDIEKALDNQKFPIFKCFLKIKNFSKNFGLYVGSSVVLVEIVMIFLTIFYNFTIFKIRVKRKFNIIDKNKKIYDIDKDNIENKKIDYDGKYKNKHINDIIKTTERHLITNNPPKKNIKINIKDGKKAISKEVLNIKKLKGHKIKNEIVYEDDEDIYKEKLSYLDSPEVYYDQSSISTMKKIEDDSILNIIKKEEKLLTVDYNYALKKNRGEFIIMIITEILDKIYLIRSIWLIKKYEMFTLNLSLYLLWHMIILFFVCFFYNNTVLHKIWIMDNYPDLKFYIVYGLISILIAYAVHRLLTYLITNDIRIEKMKRIPKDNDDEIRYKYTCLICCSIAKIIIFYILLFIFIIFFTGYLFIFSGIFPATIKKILESYGIALVIITIIKIIYGLILGILRKISLSYEIKILYNIIRFLDRYIS